MLAIIIVSTLLISAHCIPLEKDESKLQEQPQPLIKNNEEKNLAVPEIDIGGASLPGDISDSSDANPVGSPRTSDLDADSTFWGWGYYRPYYRYRSYYYPYRRYYGYGRSYGGWGWGGYYW